MSHAAKGLAGQTGRSPEPGRHLLEIVHGLNVPYGREDSFKMQQGRLIAGRFLLGIDTKDISPETALGVAAQIGMPARHIPIFQDRMAQANLIFFGVEESEKGRIYKAYLEFWEQVRRKVLTAGSKEPALLHLGFKWLESDNGAGVVSRYICHPMLDVARMLARMRAAYDGHDGCTSCQIAIELVLFAARRNAGDFIYLEAGEEGTPRKSFDINFYKAGLTLKDIAPWLKKAAAHFAIPAETFGPLHARIAGLPLGHISGGIGRDGRDFLTFYYETQPAFAKSAAKNPSDARVSSSRAPR